MSNKCVDDIRRWLNDINQVVARRPRRMPCIMIDGQRLWDNDGRQEFEKVLKALETLIQFVQKITDPNEVLTNLCANFIKLSIRRQQSEKLLKEKLN